MVPLDIIFLFLWQSYEPGPGEVFSYLDCCFLYKISMSPLAFEGIEGGDVN